MNVYNGWEENRLKYDEIRTANQEIDFQQMITIPSFAFGTLRKELIETLGIERAKGFLLRYGWNCGATVGSNMKTMTWESDEALLLAGNDMHTLYGHAEVKPLECEIDFDKGTLFFAGDWINSTEASEHIKLLGVSDHPVCHSLAGYASGYLSSILGKQVIAKETQCIAMGHKHCHWVCKTVEEWDGDPQIEQERAYYEADRIHDELEDTYEKLRIERDSLSKTYDVHLKLFKEIIYEKGLHSMANVIYETMRLPVIIETLNCEVQAVGGISLQEAEHYSNELKVWVKDQQSNKEIRETLFLEIAPGHKRVISPIYFRQNVYGYCSFLIGKNPVSEADKMVIGQVAIACSLHLLNERTRFNTVQRIRGSFLEDILSKRIRMAEIISRAHYFDFELNPPYFMVTIQRSFKETAAKEEIEFNEQLINDLFKFLQGKQIKGLLGQKSGSVMMLLSEKSLVNCYMEKESFCRKLFDFCMEKYSSASLKMGVSASYSSLEEASLLLDESMASLQVTNRNQRLVFFDSLGIVGLLLQTKNLEAIKKFANKILGHLIEEDQNKKMELSKTLYYYLENGSNINQTARAMNFSINGLRYRLGRINEILQLDISKAYNRHEIYLALQCLIVLGELVI